MHMYHIQTMLDLLVPSEDGANAIGLAEPPVIHLGLIRHIA